MKYITEDAKRTPVSHEVDVVIAGGGTSGIAAAICASRMGLKAIMIDMTSQPGGMLTHVTSWSNDFSNKGGFCKEFFNYLIDQEIFDMNWHCYNPYMVLQYVEELLDIENLTILYLSRVVEPILVGNVVKGVIVESKQGRHAIMARAVVDATGDGDVAAYAGVEYDYGRASDHAIQSISISHYLSNWQAGCISRDDIQKKIDAISDDGYKLPYNHGVFNNIVNSKSSILNTTPHVTGYSPLVAEELSEALIQLRKQAYQLYHLLKKIPETREIELGPFCAIPGIRESRRIHCDYMMTDEDVLSGREFDDGLFTVTQAIDIHKCQPDEPSIIVEHVKPYQIPFRSLLPVGIENLVVVGRCIGGSHKALASYRIIADCFAMGEAAALAVNIAIQENCNIRDVKTAKLVKEMNQRGYQN